MKKLLHIALFALGIFYLNLSYAARPMLTDDARIVDPKACQLESWIRDSKHITEYWALPACNVSENLEVTIGGSLEGESGHSSFANELYQMKSIIQPIAINQTGYSIVLGNGRDPKRTMNKVIQDWYLNVPISYPYNDRLVIHTNLGVTHLTDEKTEKMNWGLSSEYNYNEHIDLISEIFNQSSNSTYFQFGLRYWLIKNRAQIDTTYMNSFNHIGEDQSFSIGLRLLSLPFLP
ncbi:MAG: hypothetical protein RLZ31_702 [Pseudomonadota bacterium]